MGRDLASSKCPAIKAKSEILEYNEKHVELALSLHRWQSQEDKWFTECSAAMKSSFKAQWDFAMASTCMICQFAFAWLGAADINIIETRATLTRFDYSRVPNIKKQSG